MQRLFLALLIISISLSLSGCVSGPELATELPNDFELHYATGAMHKEWGVFYLDVDSQGNAIFTKTWGFDQREEHPFQASEEELLAIYNAALANGFSRNANHAFFTKLRMPYPISNPRSVLR